MGPFYRKIDGMFILAGKQPDGDSIRFKANNLNDWKKLKRSHLIKPSNVDQSVQLRLEGVDAPELHYGTARQPLGEVARDWLLNAMGFSNVTYKSDGMTVVSSQPPEVRGTILSQAAEANGRPVSYILLEADAHKAKVHNGWVYVGQDLLPSTMNARLLAASMAYLTVYSTTPDEHISLLREIAIGARNGGQGIYAADSTPLFRLVSQDDIGPQGALILPKLFRRASDYLKDVDSGAFAGNLSDWIRAHTGGSRPENDRVQVGNWGEFYLADLLYQLNNDVAFLPDVMDIVFVAK
jgi:endonuclease YncB( thermonuclease family)